jgi:hypothetical protein
MVAIGICGVFAVLERGDNIPLILLAAPVVGALEATAITRKRNNGAGGE